MHHYKKQHEQSQNEIRKLNSENSYLVAKHKSDAENYIKKKELEVSDFIKNRTKIEQDVAHEI